MTATTPLTAADRNGTTGTKHAGPQITGTDPAKFESAKDVFMRAPGDGRPYALYAKMYQLDLRATAERELVPTKYAISPYMLAKTHFDGYFGYGGCDSFAKKLLGYAESHASWGPFTVMDLNRYEAQDRNERCLHVFSQLGYLRNLGGGRYQFTMGFIAACVANCPELTNWSPIDD